MILTWFQSSLALIKHVKDTMLRFWPLVVVCFFFMSRSKRLTHGIHTHTLNAGFKWFKSFSLQMFCEEEKALDGFVRSQRDAQCVLGGNTQCKHNFSLFTRNLHLKSCKWIRIAQERQQCYRTLEIKFLDLQHILSHAGSVALVILFWLNCPNNCWMDYHDILYRHLLSPDDES